MGVRANLHGGDGDGGDGEFSLERSLKNKRSFPIVKYVIISSFNRPYELKRI